MNTNFPEYIFDQEIKNEPLYRYKIKQGQEIAKNKTIIFCGICRDVEPVLEMNIQRIEKTAKLFKSSYTFIYENDSKDNTVDILKKYESENFKFISDNRADKDYRKDLDNGVDPWHQKRCEILTECRNKYIAKISPLLDQYDYVCVIDLDLKGGWSYDGFKHGIFTLESNENVGCVTSYGVLAEKNGIDMLEDYHVSQYIMYDSFAFRPINWNFGLHILKTPMFNRISFKRGNDPIEVVSNFGGLAIYKSNAIKNKSYKVKVWGYGMVDSEHIEFHKKIADDGFKVIMDPSMIVSYSHHKYSKGI